MCSRGIHSLGDQLGRADAGSWQMYRRLLRHGELTRAARGVAIGDFRVRFVVEP